jgi:anti-sigma B factor antagonist
MSVQPEHTGSGETLHHDIDGLAAGSVQSGTIESSQCTAREIIVLRVAGEVDLCTIPILAAALDASLDQRPAYLVVDLAQMTFCSMRGLDLLTQTGRITAATATGYAVTGVSPQIHRVWTLCWGSDRPICYRSTAAAVRRIWAAESDIQVHRPRQALGTTSRPKDFQRGRNGFPPTRLDPHPETDTA